MSVCGKSIDRAQAYFQCLTKQAIEERLALFQIKNHYEGKIYTLQLNFWQISRFLMKKLRPKLDLSKLL